MKAVKAPNTKFLTASAAVYSKTYLFVARHNTKLLLVAGLVFIHSGLEGLSYAASGDVKNVDLKEIASAICRLYALMDKGFGALLMTVAGVGAIVASAMGGYRAATTMLVTGIGSFIMRSVVDLFFPGINCQGGVATSWGSVGFGSGESGMGGIGSCPNGTIMGTDGLCQ